ncbi:hypothetical protein EDB80DRAFT_865306 [Ilyonectria destructans]|nr:hypothetical protein EDB80DRAFT_865306 [Ilyonectria destructans]
MAKLTPRCGESPIDTTDLPIADILEKIDHMRQDLIDHLFDGLNNFCDSLCQGDDTYSYERSSMLLGSLMKEIHKLGHLTPSATRIYHGYSVADLMKRISDFQLPKWYGVSDLPRQGKQRTFVTSQKGYNQCWVKLRKV